MRIAVGAALALLTLPACTAPARDAGQAQARAETPSGAQLAMGERAYQKCYACHALEPGGRSLDGPSLESLVGRGVAAKPGFDYSPALRKFAAANPRWTPALLDRFLADPQAVAPGNAMGFFGIDDPAERRALIAYLASRRVE